MGVFDIRLVPSVCAKASLDPRERGVEVEVEVEMEVFFAVDPVFFGWEDLAEEKREKEKEGREYYETFFFPQMLRCPPTKDTQVTSTKALILSYLYSS